MSVIIFMLHNCFQEHNYTYNITWGTRADHFDMKHRK
jgi:hypothetical protein